MSKTELAALLALSSALCVAIGDVLQQKAAHCIAEASAGPIELLGKLIRNGRWLWGVLILAASIVLQAAALGQGSVLLVQALLMLSLMFALPINARLSNRTVTADEWIWSGLLTAAVIVVVTVGDPQAGRSGASLKTWAAVCVVLVPLLAVCVVVGRVRGGAVAAALYAFVAGSLWGVFAVLTKEVDGRLGAGGWAVARTPELYACVLMAVGGFAWGQSAFRAGPLTASMPALQIAQPVMGAVLGVVVLDETLTTNHIGMAALAVAAAVMTIAIVKLAHVDAVTTQDRADAALDDLVGQPA